ncbi:Bromodomain-containing protein, partial [Zancudomyces culisetae]
MMAINVAEPTLEQDVGAKKNATEISKPQQQQVQEHSQEQVQPENPQQAENIRDEDVEKNDEKVEDMEVDEKQVLEQECKFEDVPTESEITGSEKEEVKEEKAEIKEHEMEERVVEHDQENEKSKVVGEQEEDMELASQPSKEQEIKEQEMSEVVEKEEGKGLEAKKEIEKEVKVEKEVEVEKGTETNLETKEDVKETETKPVEIEIETETEKQQKLDMCEEEDKQREMEVEASEEVKVEKSRVAVEAETGLDTFDEVEGQEIIKENLKRKQEDVEEIKGKENKIEENEQDQVKEEEKKEENRIGEREKEEPEAKKARIEGEEHRETQISKEQSKYIAAMLRSLKRHRDAGPFLEPVDVEGLGIHDYPIIVKHAMDLGTVERRFKEQKYTRVEDFIKDMELIFNNCYLYNGKELPVSLMAQNLENAFRNQLKKMPANTVVKPDSVVEKEGEVRRQKRETHPPPSKDIPTNVNAGKSHKKGSVSSVTGANGVTTASLEAHRLKFCGTVIREMFKKTYTDIGYLFYEPVDWKELNIPQYPKVIKNPMDLGTIRKKYDAGLYNSSDEFEADVRLMFNNCYKFNPPNHPVHLAGKRFEEIFDKKWAELPTAEQIQQQAKPSRRRESSTTSVDSSLIQSLEQSLLDITRQIQVLKQSDEYKRNEELTSSQSVSASGRGKQRPSSVSKHQSKSKRKTSSSGSTKQHRRKASGSTTESLSNEYDSKMSINNGANVHLTLAQKKSLSNKIESLPFDKLQTAIDIIKSAYPHLISEEEEIELDIEQLDNETVKRLYDFVVLNKPATFSNRSRVSAAGSNSSGSVNSTSKHSSYSSHPRDSLMLEQKLMAFDSDNKSLSSKNTAANNNTLKPIVYSSSSSSSGSSPCSSPDHPSSSANNNRNKIIIKGNIPMSSLSTNTIVAATDTAPPNIANITT